MKKQVLAAACLIILSGWLYSQNDQTKNFVYINVDVPVFVDENTFTKNKHPNVEDESKANSNMNWNVNISLKNVDINVAGNSFSGFYTSKYYPYEKIVFQGRVSADRMMLEYLSLQRNYNVGDQYSSEKLSARMVFEQVPMFNGVCKYEKGRSTVVVHDYTYEKQEHSRYYDRKVTRKFVALNEEKIPDDPRLAYWKIKINIYMDGPQSYMIYEEETAGPEEDWQPPIAAIVGDEKPFTPNYTASYVDMESMDERSGYYADTFRDRLEEEIMFAHDGWGVADREYLNEIIGELLLNQSSMIDESQRVNSDITKEEVSIFIEADCAHKTLIANIKGRKAAYRVSAYNFDEENYEYVEEALCKRVVSVLERIYFED